MEPTNTPLPETAPATKWGEFTQPPAPQIIFSDKADYYKQMRRATPQFARFKAWINFTNGGNKHISKSFFSYDYRPLNQTTQLTYDEQKGWYLLLDYITKSLHPKDYNIVTIFANMTFDLSTSKRNYNEQLMVFTCGDIRGCPQLYFDEYTNAEGVKSVKLNVKATQDAIQRGEVNKDDLRGLWANIAQRTGQPYKKTLL